MIVASLLDNQAALVRGLLEAEISRLEMLTAGHPDGLPGEDFGTQLEIAKYALANLHNKPPRTAEQQAAGTNDPYRRRTVRS